VGLAILVPFWGLVGLRSSWQMYLLAIIFGGTSPSLSPSPSLNSRTDEEMIHRYIRIVPVVREDLFRRVDTSQSSGKMVRTIQYYRQVSPPTPCTRSSDDTDDIV
jgi:hypothetical protein